MKSIIFQAALLHDTIEDTETTLEELQQEFGSRISGIHIVNIVLIATDE
jgi:(p)ppGpp synthase/HD superfamily hydrolase